MGSHSHGTYIPPTEPNAIDDLDLMGFVIPPLEYHIGLPKWENWRLQVDELDVVLYSLDKAFRLLLKNNPNIVGLLWLREQDYTYQHTQFRWLTAYRDIFSAKSAADAFCGYAYGQLKRMEAFNVARMDEYERYTTEIARKGIGSGYQNPIKEVIDADSNKIKHLAIEWGVRQDFLQAFRQLHRSHFSGYMGEKRKAMVRQFEYDVKNAAHLIRLLRMGKEFLETGELRVYRTDDAEQLKAIKRGEWKLEDVKLLAEHLFTAIRQAEAESKLPAKPDDRRANQLLMNIHCRVLDLSVGENYGI